MLKIRYMPFEEDIVVVGGKGRGKSKQVMEILGKPLNNLPYVIHDYNNIFSGFGTIARRPSEVHRGQIIYQGDKSMAGFVALCNRVFYGAQSGELSNTVFGVDELHQYYRNKQTVIPEFENIVSTARNYGVSGIYVSTRPATIPNTVLSNATHCFAFGLANESDIIWLRGYIGEKAWLLIPADKRKKLVNEKQLTKHSFLYRNQNEPETQIEVCHCADCNLQRQQFPEAFF